jgi:hypothetical protein
VTGGGRREGHFCSLLSCERVGVRLWSSYDSIASIQEERRGGGPVGGQGGGEGEGEGGKILESKTEELNFHRHGPMPVNPTLTSGAPLPLLRSLKTL